MRAPVRLHPSASPATPRLPRPLRGQGTHPTALPLLPLPLPLLLPLPLPLALLLSPLQGRGASIACSVFQCVMLVLVTIAYSITSVKAMQTAAARLGSGFDATWQLTLIVGAIELAFSQIPNLEQIW